jgi:hypothetical protein
MRPQEKDFGQCLREIDDAFHNQSDSNIICEDGGGKQCSGTTQPYLWRKGTPSSEPMKKGETADVSEESVTESPEEQECSVPTDSSK